MKMPETEIGAAITEWLRKQDFQVYPEVAHANFGVADIVARRGGIICIVECKVNFGLNVMEQAIRWTGTAHYVYVATRRLYGGGRRRSWDGRAARAVMERYGVGLLLVRPGWRERTHHIDPDVDEAIRPDFNRRVKTERLHHVLDTIPGDWEAEAGSQWAQQWTPFKQTCRDVADFVRKHPGCTFKVMLVDVATHYSTPTTARSVLPKWIDQGMIEGVFCDRSVRPMRLWPVDPEKWTAYYEAEKAYRQIRGRAMRDRTEVLGHGGSKWMERIDAALARVNMARQAMMTGAMDDGEAAGVVASIGLGSRLSRGRRSRRDESHNDSG